LNRKYSRLTGLVGLDDCTDNYAGNATVSFLGDDRNLQTFDILPGDFPVTVNIDVSGVRKLTVVVSPKYVFTDLIDMALQ
jgi:hypothetical protein